MPEVERGKPSEINIRNIEYRRSRKALASSQEIHFTSGPGNEALAGQFRTSKLENYSGSPGLKCLSGSQQCTVQRTWQDKRSVKSKK
jgi:hypothetical protein